MNLGGPHYFFVFFVFLWLGVNLGVAQLSGWGELSRCYRSGDPFEGRKWKFRRGQMRLLMKYSNCLTIGANPQGLYLAVFFLFRIGHPRLLVPWQDISVTTGKTLFWKWIEFRFRQAPSVWLRIYGSLADEVRLTAGPFWPGERNQMKDRV